MASSLVNGVPYKIFICLKSVDLPDSPAPKIKSLILRDSAAQLWVSERESCDGGVVCDGAGRARRAIAATRARACEENDAVAYLAVALAPAAVVGLDGRAAAHVFMPPGCCDGQRARGRGFSQCDGCPLDVSRLLLASAAPAGPRRRRQDKWTEGAAKAGAKTLDRFPTSAAATVSCAD